MKIVVEMPWEKNLTVNHMRFGAKGGYRKRPEVQAWMEASAWSIKSKIRGGGWGDLHPPIKVLIEFRYPDQRWRDDHNYYKVIADAVAAGLGIDDKDIRLFTVSNWTVPQNPGFTITITDEVPS